MAIFAVFIPIGLLAVLVALGRYEELMLPPLTDEPEEVDPAALSAGTRGRTPPGRG